MLSVQECGRCIPHVLVRDFPPFLFDDYGWGWDAAATGIAGVVIVVSGGNCEQCVQVCYNQNRFTSLTLFWALFGLAIACPHLFPPGKKSSASASLARVHLGEVSIASYFRAPNSAFHPCCALHGILNFSKHCLKLSCHPFRWMNRFCCSMAVALQSSYMMSGGWMLYSSLYML